MAKRKGKKPYRKIDPSPEKVPRGRKKVEDSDIKLIVWHVGKIDKDGPWGWKDIEPERLWNNIHSKMSSFESMTWDEVMKGGDNHPVSVDGIIPDARRRLEEIGQDDIDELFSLRLSGRERIYGIRAGHIFKVLWRDPNHQVCPVPLRHT